MQKTTTPSSHPICRSQQNSSNKSNVLSITNSPVLLSQTASMLNFDDNNFEGDIKLEKRSTLHCLSNIPEEGRKYNDHHDADNNRDDICDDDNGTSVDPVP